MVNVILSIPNFKLLLLFNLLFTLLLTSLYYEEKLLGMKIISSIIFSLILLYVNILQYSNQIKQINLDFEI
jgi:hypothetical protein